MKNSYGERSVVGRLLAVAGGYFLAISLCCIPALAQTSLPQGLGNAPEQLLQRPATADVPASNPSPMQLQPAVPRYQTRLPRSRLEQILSARAGMRLDQFGYDQIGRAAAVVVPQTGAVQDDYVLGPGDEVIISLRGQENNRFDVTVDRNGQVTVPRLPPIAASGRTFGSFREDLEAAVHRAYVATEASVSVGRVRQISVLVSGEVAQPGQQLLTGLSSAVDALLLAGGVNKTGSLRNIRIQRGGHEYTVDLYSVLTSRGGTKTFRLADGDRILVPPLGQTVAVAGLVRRPGIYEMAPGASAMPVSVLQSLAGGQEVRGRYRISVLRILPDGRSEMTGLPDGNGVVHDGEVLFVQLGADNVAGQATLSGASGLAGAYPVISGTHLSEVLRAPGALGTSPYTPFGIIIRRDPVTLMPVLLRFTPTAVLGGREDQILQSDDVIRVFSTNEARLLTFIVDTYLGGLASQQNIIRNPLGQRNDLQNNLAGIGTSRSGQFETLESVGAVPADIQRNQILGLLDVGAPGSALALRQATQAQRLQYATVSPNSGNADGNGNGNGNVNFNGNGNNARRDQQPVSQQTSDEAMPQLQNAEAQRQETEPATNFIDENVITGGFASNREVETFGQLARQLNVDPLILINFLVDCRARLDGAVRGAGYYFVGPNVSLAELIQAAGGTVNWGDGSGVELISTTVDRQGGRAVTQRINLPLNKDTLDRYIVRAGDQLHFNQVYTDVGAGIATIQGEVRFPGAFALVRGEHLSDLLTRAGGLTNVAYPYGTVFLRKSTAQVEREGYIRAANEVESQLITGMNRAGSNKLDPTTFASMQSFVSELRNQQALGRISIIADPSVLASKPALDPLLEPGDMVFIPQRPSTISVLGQVLQPGSYPYERGESVEDYIAHAGGYSQAANESETFIVLPDGSARRMERSWLNLDSSVLPPGSSIIVPRDLTPFDLRQTIIDVSQIMGQLAVSVASIAVISRN